MRWIIPTCVALLALTGGSAEAQSETLTVSASVRDPVSAAVTGALRVAYPSPGEMQVTAPLRVDGGTATIVRFQGEDGSAVGCPRSSSSPVGAGTAVRGRMLDAVLRCRVPVSGGTDLPLTLIVAANA